MESNRWAICINLNSLKEFDDLFENKEEIVSQTETDYNNFFPKYENISFDTIKIFGPKWNGFYFQINVEACWFLFYLVGNCYLLLIKNYLFLTYQKPHRTSLDDSSSSSLSF